MRICANATGCIIGLGFWTLIVGATDQRSSAGSLFALNPSNQLHVVIQKADMVVIQEEPQGGWFRGSNELCRITDWSVIADLTSNIVFTATQPGTSCNTFGYPRIRWFAGTNELASVTLVENTLRWKRYVDDMFLTDKSAKWIHLWLERRGIRDPRQYPAEEQDGDL